MIFCSICNSNLNGYINVLRKHIIRVHGIALGTGSTQSCSNFVCGQNGCLKSYNLFNSLRAHIIKKHPIRPSTLNNEISCVLTEPHCSLPINKPNLNEDNNQHLSFNENNNTDTEAYSQQLTENELDFLIKKSVCEMRSNSSITNAAVQTSVEMCAEITTNICQYLKTNVLNYFHEKKIEISDDKSQNLLNSFDVSNIFNKIKTPVQQKKFISSFTEYNEPLHVKLGTRTEITVRNDENITIEVDETFAYVSIIKTLTTLVQNHNIRRMFEAERPSSDGILKSYLDGKQYKNHEFFQKYPNALRISIYFDDVEITNPLGTKCRIHELAMFYFTIQNVSPYFNSNTSNIFIFNIAHSLDIKKYGFSNILKNFMQDINLLESDEGVKVKLENNESYTLRATLVNFIGDNKAAHEIFEFFGASATMFCRHCLINRKNLHDDPPGTSYENRTPQNYAEHLEQLRKKEIQPKTVGIHKNSYLNTSKYFHCTTNYTFDIMHDILEGVIHVAIKHVLRFLIVEEKLFTVEYLNNGINRFNYGKVESKNKPSSNFTRLMISNNENSIKQYAVQSWLLLRALPFILYEKLENVHTDHMYLLYLLEKIIEILFSLQITPYMLIQLHEYIYEFERLFKTLFPTVKKTNKIHHMSHYIECIEQMGPIGFSCCLRYETKHQTAKKQMHISGNFKNVTKSVADRQIFKQNVHLLTTLDTRSIISSTSTKFVLASECLSKNFLSLNEIVQKCKSVTIDFIQYRVNHIVQLEDLNCLFPQFVKIIEIIEKNKKMYFLGKVFKIVDYNHSLNSFEVNESSEECFHEFSEIIEKKPMSFWRLTNDNRKFLKIKTYIF